LLSIRKKTCEEKLSFTVSTATCSGRKTDFTQSAAYYGLDIGPTQNKLCRKFCDKCRCL